MPTIPDLPERDLAAFERRLAGLIPDAAHLDADRMLYEAGRAAVRRSWFGPVRTLAAIVIVAGFGSLYLQERAARRAAEQGSSELRAQLVALRERLPDINRSPLVAAPAPHAVVPADTRPEEPSPAPNSYLALTQQYRTHGLQDSPPRSQPARSAEPSPTEPTLSPMSVRSFDRMFDL